MLNENDQENSISTTDFDKCEDQSSDDLDKINVAFLAPMEDQNALGVHLNPSGLAIMKFCNPPRRNLCFSNVTATCLLNILPIRNYLWKNRVNFENKVCIGSEMYLLSKHESDKPKSTKKLRAIVMQKCLESGQTERNFDNNMQFDCVEFFQTLLEHLWKELSLTDNLNETVFGACLPRNL